MKITDKLLLEWIQHLANNGYSTYTLTSYKSDLKLFLNRLKIQNWETVGTFIDEKNIRLTEIENRKTILSQTPTPCKSIYRMKRPTLSPSTIQGKIISIKSFLKFLNNFYDVGLDYRKIETKKIKSDYIECLTENEYQTFFNYIWTYEKYKVNSLRMQLLCNIAYTSGMRLSEILNLKVDQVKSWECRITWKWRKTRRVFFSKSSEELLENYLEERAKPTPWTWKTVIDSDFIFTSLNIGRYSWLPMKKNTVCERIKKYSDSLDIWKRITIHSLRHSYATRLLESGFNIREIQELLGHCDIQTTEWYCHVLKSSLKNKVSLVFN